MKKGLIMVSLIVGVLLCSLIVSAEEQTQEQTESQEQYQTYSGWGRFTDNVKMFFSGEDNKVRLALEIREKEVYSAISNVQNQKEDSAVKNLERAKKRLQLVQEKVSLDTSEEIKTSVGDVTAKINNEDDLPDEFDDYLLEEEKTQLTAVLTEKTYEYCVKLANEDFALMLGDEECNPETAIPGLEKDLKKLKKLQEESFIRLMLEIRSCIDDPGTCNCEASLDDDERAKCEKMVTLAVKCEYKEDETSCGELEAMMPSPGDGFARSFIPDYLMGSFEERRDLIEYNLEHSDGVPEECWNDNDKPECEKYAALKEDGLDWDAQGNWIGWQRGKIKATNGTMEPSVPTMQESIPQCFDEEGVFLEEKCGKVTIVWNADGLINYLIGNQIDNVIEEFENKSRQYAPGTYANGTMDVNGNVPMEIRSGWMMENNEWVIDPGYQEMKKGMNQIRNQIQNITYAMGTGPGGVGGVVVDGDGNVVTDGDGNVVVTNDMSVDAGPVTDDSGGGDGSICCKKTKDGETRHHWDSEEDCLDPGNIKGEVVDNDVCLSLGQEVLDEEDPESWGSVEGGVPAECVAQGAYDDEACERIMEMVEICCRKTIDGEVSYEWIPGKICVSPYGDRVDEGSC
ncbi:MAG: hypothetical protein KKF50_01370 [Nanoarchaeota archaeon]|nr:hypothetical protein [Nanoarchaeota archaeon]